MGKRREYSCDRTIYNEAILAVIVIINLENQNKIECMMRDQSTESRRDDESSSGENSEKSNVQQRE